MILFFFIIFSSMSHADWVVLNPADRLVGSILKADSMARLESLTKLRKEIESTGHRCLWERQNQKAPLACLFHAVYLVKGNLLTAKQFGEITSRLEELCNSDPGSLVSEQINWSLLEEKGVGRKCRQIGLHAREEQEYRSFDFGR